MANVANHIKINFRAPANNRIAVPGYYAEYTAADYGEMVKSGATDSPGEAAVTANQKLYYDEAAKAVILRPDISPIDMTSREQIYFAFNAAGDAETLTYDRGDWFELNGHGDTTLSYGDDAAKWSFMYPEGEPRRRLIFQDAVEYQNDDGETVAVPWLVMAGEGYGWAGGPPIGENQGVVVYFDSNKLPDNAENELIIHLFHRDPETGAATNGVYVGLKGGNEARLCHYIDLSATAAETKIPPERAVYSQWVRGSVSPGEKLVDWTDNSRFYVLRMLDGRIYFSVNGLDNALTLEAENYDIGTSRDGLTYPVLLRAGATLGIQGKGQALFGFKRLAYVRTSTLNTPVFAVGYTLGNQRGQVVRAVRGTNDQVSSAWQTRGTGDAQQVRGTVTLTGTPAPVMEIPVGDPEKAVAAYLATVSDTTPMWRKAKFWDKQVRSAATVTLPSAIDGEVVSYTETVSCDDNGVMSDYSLSVEVLGTLDKMRADLLARKRLIAEPSITLRGASVAVSAGRFSLTAPSVRVQGYGDVSLFMKGRNAAFDALHQPAGFVISYDDREITDVAAMADIATMAGVTISSSVTGARLPETVEGEEGAWTFQPNTTFWEILSKLATVQGHHLYVAGDVLYYAAPGTTATITLGRGETYPTDGIEIEQGHNYRSPIYVIGRAAETVGGTNPHKAGDKLVGIWRDATLEAEVGYSPHVKTDPSLSTWARVQEAGDHLWSTLNERAYKISFDLTDARAVWADLKPFAVVEWNDPAYPEIDGEKFVVVGYSKTLDGSRCEASVELMAA